MYLRRNMSEVRQEYNRRRASRLTRGAWRGSHGTRDQVLFFVRIEAVKFAVMSSSSLDRIRYAKPNELHGELPGQRTY